MEQRFSNGKKIFDKYQFSFQRILVGAAPEYYGGKFSTFTVLFKSWFGSFQFRWTRCYVNCLFSWHHWKRLVTVNQKSQFRRKERHSQESQLNQVWFPEITRYYVHEQSQ